MVVIINIECQRKEYKKINNIWKTYKVTKSIVDNHFITSMLEGGYYYAKLGGNQYIYYSSTRGFKNVVTKIVVDSIDNTIKCIYTFSYVRAKLCNNIDYLF